MHRAAALRGHARHFKPAPEFIPPFGFCTLRLVLALPFLWWLALKEGSRRFRSAELLYIPPMAFAIGIAYSFIFVCNQRSGPIATAMVQPLMPISTGAFLAVLGLEPSSLQGVWNVGGDLRNFTGTQSILDEHRTRSLDVFLLVIQASSYGVYIVLLTRALGQSGQRMRSRRRRLKRLLRAGQAATRPHAVSIFGDSPWQK